MIVECKNCGAPLDVDGTTRFVKCSYCHKTNRVRTMRTLHFERPPGWVPPPSWTPPATTSMPRVPLPRRPAPPPRRSGPVWMLALVALAPMALVAGLVAWQLGMLEFLPSWSFDPDGPPQVRAIDLDAEPTPGWLTGETGSWVTLSSLDGVTCSGHVPREPHFVLRTAHGAALSLETESAEDNVLLLVTSDGQYICDDDSGGAFNAAISMTVPAGEHRVWVGSYASGGSFPFRLRVTASTVDAAIGADGLAPDASPSLGRLELSPGVAHAFDGQVEPFVGLADISPRCRGFVPVGPHVVVEATAPERARFVTRDSDADLVMAVRTPDGHFHCDDDSGDGLNPMVDVDLTVGRTAVWVGTYRADAVARFTLDVGAPRGRSGVGVGVDPIAPPALGTVNLDVPGWTTTYQGTSRAEVNEHAHVDPRCRGWTGRAPDLTVLTTIERPVQIRVDAERSTSLMVRGPHEGFDCDAATAEGTRRDLTPGSHQIWVGQRGRRPTPFTLTIDAP